MSAIKVGDFVKVVSGPAFVESGRPIKGRAVEVTSTDAGGPEVMVRVASGGVWGFRASDLAVLPRGLNG